MGQAVEMRLRRTDVSEEAMQQRVTRTFLRIRQSVDEDPETEDDPPVVGVVTLTIEPGQKVSTSGTGPGALNGSVLLLGRPQENKSSVMTDQLVPLQLVSRDKFFAGSLKIPGGWNTLEMEFTAGGENLGKYGGFSGGEPEPEVTQAKVFNSLEEVLEADRLADQPEDQKVWFVRSGERLDWYTCFNSLGDVNVKLYLDGTLVHTLEHELTADESFAGWITYVDQWVKGTSFQWEVPLEELPLPAQTLASVIATGPAAGGMTAQSAGNALLAGAVLTTETSVPLAPAPINATLGAPVADIIELGTLAAVRVLPPDALNFQPALTLNPGGIYWLAGGVLRPLAQEQLETLLPQAGGVTLVAAAPTGGNGGNLNAGAGNGAPADNTESGKLHNLTRAALIPIFNVIAQVEGIEAVARGLFDGAKEGIKDDRIMLCAIGNGLVTAGNWSLEARAAANAELQKWRTDPIARAEHFKSLAKHFCEEMVFKPMQNAGGALAEGFSSWDKFKQRAWRFMERFAQAHTTLADAHVRLLDLTKDEAGSKLADGLTAWADDFGRRMMVQSEYSAFADAPWRKDELFSGAIDVVRERAYTFGYMEGYLVEQVFLGGAVVGGGIKIGKVLWRGGVSLAKGLVLPLKTSFQVGARMNLAKNIVDPALVTVIDRAMARAARTPLVEGVVNQTVLDAIEEALERLGVKRANFGTRQYVEAQILNRPNIKALILQEGAENAFTHNLGLFYNAMGGQIDDKLLANFVKAFDEKLIVTAPNGALRDFSMEFMLSFKGQPQLLGDAITTARLQALGTATDIDKAAMKAAFQDGGSVWSIDNVVTSEMPVAAVRRGVVCETAYYYQHRWADGWLRDATKKGIDWWKGSVVEQFKTTINLDLGEMKKFLSDMLEPGRSVGGKTFVLDVRVPPSSTLDRNAFKTTVDEYISSLEFQRLVRDDELVQFKIDVYDFHPN